MFKEKSAVTVRVTLKIRCLLPVTLVCIFCLDLQSRVTLKCIRVFKEKSAVTVRVTLKIRCLLPVTLVSIFAESMPRKVTLRVTAPYRPFAEVTVRGILEKGTKIGVCIGERGRVFYLQRFLRQV